MKAIRLWWSRVRSRFCRHLSYEVISACESQWRPVRGNASLQVRTCFIKSRCTCCGRIDLLPVDLEYYNDTSDRI